MTLQASGAISLTDVLNELKTANAGRALPISLGDADVLALAGKGAPPISLSDLYGKSAYVALTGATVTPTSLTADTGMPNVKQTVGPATAAPTPANATGVTYSWEFVSGSTVTVNSPTSASTTFSYTGSTSSGSRTGVYRCKVTQGGTSYYTPNVTVLFAWSNL